VLSRFSSELAAQVLPENRLAELVALLDSTKSKERASWARGCP